MKKYEQIADMLRRRIGQDDYGHKSIPGARKLADETGVSYVTALKALQYMVQEGWAVRAENGRIIVDPSRIGGGHPGLRVAYLSPVRDNQYYLWENAVHSAALELECSFRLIPYVHPEDPVVAEVLKGDYDVIFISHPLDKGGYTRDLVLRNKEKVVTMFNDMTDEGVCCLDGPEPKDIEKLVSYLYKLGHRNFASLSVCSLDNSTQSKVEYWCAAVSACGLKSKNFSRQLRPFELSLLPAYNFSRELLKDGAFEYTAVFAPTLQIALGMIRALYDNGMQAGREVSVCSFGQPERARINTPSVTVIDRPDPKPQVKEILQQYLNGVGKRLMFRPESGNLLLGESTGPVQAGG